MEDPELEAIRQRRMAEMQQQAQNAGRQRGQHKQADAAQAGKGNAGRRLEQPPEAFPVQDDHGHDGPQLDDDLKGGRLIAGKAEQIARKNEMPGRRDGQKLRQSFHNAENNGCQP